MANISPLKVQTTVTLPRTLKAEIEEYSEKTGVSMSVLIRHTLTKFLIEQKKGQACAIDCVEV